MRVEQEQRQEDKLRDFERRKKENKIKIMSVNERIISRYIKVIV